MRTDDPKNKIDLEKNPKGTELKVALQREREKTVATYRYQATKVTQRFLYATERIQKNASCLSLKRLITELQCGIKMSKTKLYYLFLAVMWWLLE